MENSKIARKSSISKSQTPTNQKEPAAKRGMAENLTKPNLISGKAGSSLFHAHKPKPFK
jgi:hypothetical protein